jgi:hypothetical protein
MQTKDTTVVPVNFNKEHKAMLGYCKMILEQDPGNEKIAINPDKFDNLITSLRTAVDNDGTLDKESTSYNDIFDAFRLALKFYHFRDSSNMINTGRRRKRSNYCYYSCSYSSFRCDYTGIIKLHS